MRLLQSKGSVGDGVRLQGRHTVGRRRRARVHRARRESAPRGAGAAGPLPALRAPRAVALRVPPAEAPRRPGHAARVLPGARGAAEGGAAALPVARRDAGPAARPRPAGVAHDGAPEGQVRGRPLRRLPTGGGAVPADLLREPRGGGALGQPRPGPAALLVAPAPQPDAAQEGRLRRRLPDRAADDDDRPRGHPPRLGDPPVQELLRGPRGRAAAGHPHAARRGHHGPLQHPLDRPRDRAPGDVRSCTGSAGRGPASFSTAPCWDCRTSGAS